MGQGISRVPQAPASGESAAGREPSAATSPSGDGCAGSIWRSCLRARGCRGARSSGSKRGRSTAGRTAREASCGPSPRRSGSTPMMPSHACCGADAAQLGPPRAALWLAGATGLALLAGAVLLLRALIASPVLRPLRAACRCAAITCRALAEAHGIEPDELTARDTVLPPPPAELPAPDAAASAAGEETPGGSSGAA